MDIFRPFLQRLSQPIVLAFCISWIFWNWEIVVALLWYSADNVIQLKNGNGEGYNNHIAYINDYKDPWKNYWCPLIFAGLYPVVILALNNTQTYFKKYEEKIFFWISKDANVPTKFYLDAQDDIEQKERRISKFIEKENEMLSTINDLKIENAEFSENISLMSEEVENLQSINGSLNNELSDMNELNVEKSRKSHIEFLVGNFNIEILETIPQSTRLETIISGVVKFRVNNDDDFEAVLIFDKQPIISSVIFYAYHVDRDSFTLTLSVNKDNIHKLTTHERSVLEILQTCFMDTTNVFHAKNSRLTTYISQNIADPYRVELERIKNP